MALYIKELGGTIFHLLGDGSINDVSTNITNNGTNPTLTPSVVVGWNPFEVVIVFGFVFLACICCVTSCVFFIQWAEQQDISCSFYVFCEELKIGWQTLKQKIKTSYQALKESQRKPVGGAGGVQILNGSNKQTYQKLDLRVDVLDPHFDLQ